MREVTTTKTVYQFNELTDEAKETAINNHIEANDFDFLSDLMNERLHELLEESKFETDNEKNVELYFSLSYSQGDGACFIGDFEYQNYQVTITHQAHYYHELSTTLDIIEMDEDEGHEVPEEKIKEIKDAYVEMCINLKSDGYAYIENENDPQWIEEQFTSNEQEFNENGSQHY